MARNIEINLSMSMGELAAIVWIMAIAVVIVGMGMKTINSPDIMRKIWHVESVETNK